VAKSIEPSVVGIETTRVVRGRLRDEWSQFFQSGEGSGVIVDEAGYVVTNAHVIDGASELTIKLSDGRTVENVALVGADLSADLAVLKIGAGGLVAATWGDSDQLEVGDEVLAVGNPYQLDRTVTAGIVSAKDRPGVVGELPRAEFLQTDAAVNPGNSGGPLVNMKGEVVGINLAIVGPSYRGISFAIPSNRVREVYERLRRTGTVAPRGFLGVNMWDVSEQLAFELRLDEVTGVLVARVEPDSPADEAGVRQRDVILEWNGQKIESKEELAMAVARSKVGSTASLIVFREGRRIELTVEVGQRPILATP
jgi:serine protease Do